MVRSVLEFAGRSGVDGINVTSVAANVGVTKHKAAKYLEALEAAFVIQRVFPAGTNVLREPKVLLVPPVRLLYREMQEAQGGLREDFLVMHGGEKIAMEIGGRSKGYSQFKGVENCRRIILAPNMTTSPGRIPLHLLGFLQTL
jgi:hypothetical protein